jgi:hypothetical protein
MNRITTTLFTGLFALVLAACAGPANDSNHAATNAAPPASGAASQNRNQSAANANSSSSPSSANSNSSATSGALDASKLVGTYDLNQIQKGGVTTMMSEARVQLVFTADGRYTRAITTSKGKLVHNESGQFELAGDKLTFKVILTGKTINPTPKIKDYIVALSPDGRELKLTSPTGEMAVFYRAT